MPKRRIDPTVQALPDHGSTGRQRHVGGTKETEDAVENISVVTVVVGTWVEFDGSIGTPVQEVAKVFMEPASEHPT